LVIGTCERAKTNLDLIASPASDFAAIFSSFRIEDAFFAIPSKSRQCDPVADDAPSVRFFVDKTAVSTISGRQSTPTSRFGRPNTP
jgi:hypothetical protein